MPKRRSNYYSRKLSKLMKPKYVEPLLPNIAHTNFITKVGMQLTTDNDTLVNGYLYLGALQPTVLENPFYNVPRVHANGSLVATDTQTTAFFNTTGADNFMTIYSQMRVANSELVIVWRNNTPQVSNESIADSIDFTSATGSIPAHDHVHYAQTALCLVAIPSTSATTNPADDQQSVMAHPFAIKSWQRRHGVNGSWNKLHMPAINHARFLRMMNNNPNTTVGEEYHKKEFEDDQEVVGQDIFIHLYVVDPSGYKDTADCEIEGQYILRQHTYMYKHTGEDASLMDLLGEQVEQDEGELIATHVAN